MFTQEKKKFNSESWCDIPYMAVVVLETLRCEKDNNRLRVRDLTERFFAYSQKTDTLDSLIVLLTDQKS